MYYNTADKHQAHRRHSYPEEASSLVLLQVKVVTPIVFHHHLALQLAVVGDRLRTRRPCHTDSHHHPIIYSLTDCISNAINFPLQLLVEQGFKSHSTQNRSFRRRSFHTISWLGTEQKSNPKTNNTKPKWSKLAFELTPSLLHNTKLMWYMPRHCVCLSVTSRCCHKLAKQIELVLTSFHPTYTVL